LPIATRGGLQVYAAGNSEENQWAG